MCCARTHVTGQAGQYRPRCYPFYVVGDRRRHRFRGIFSCLDLWLLPPCCCCRGDFAGAFIRSLSSDFAAQRMPDAHSCRQSTCRPVGQRFGAAVFIATFWLLVPKFSRSLLGQSEPPDRGRSGQ